MKVLTNISVEEKTRSMMKTLAQVSNRSTGDLWQEAADNYLRKYYASTLRKAAKEISSSLSEIPTINVVV